LFQTFYRLYCSISFMKFPLWLALIIMCILPSALRAQNKYTISGYVKEARSGETVFGANVYIKETLQGTQTNQYGFYSLTVPEGKYTLVFSYIGFEEQLFELNLVRNILKNIDLNEKSFETKEV